MQLMAAFSEEERVHGLGWYDADVVRFVVCDYLTYKLPHMGWNQIVKTKEIPLMKNIPDFSEYYFVHSYHLRCNDLGCVLSETEYESRFPSAVSSGIYSACSTIRKRVARRENNCCRIS